MKLGYHIQTFDHGGKGVLVYPQDKESHELGESLDCEAVILALQDSINALKAGNGIEATAACAEAFLRLGMFHRYGNKL